jgi:hypothetical protein
VCLVLRSIYVRSIEFVRVLLAYSSAHEHHHHYHILYFATRKVSPSSYTNITPYQSSVVPGTRKKYCPSLDVYTNRHTVGGAPLPQEAPNLPGGSSNIPAMA